MPKYNWHCQVCDSVNPASAITCNQCSCPAEVNAYEIECRKIALGTQKTLAEINFETPSSALSLSKIIRETLFVIWDKRLRLFQALILVSMALVGLEMVYAYIWLDKPGMIYSLFYIAVYAILFTLFAVTCHRIVLLSNSEVPKYGIYSWSPRETRFLGWTIVGYLFFTLITTLVGAFVMPFVYSNNHASYVIWLVILPGAYVFSRLSILLPATAVGERRNLKWAWDFTANNGWRLFLIVALLPQLMTAAYIFIEWPEHLIIQFSVGLLVYVLAAIEIAALSVSYRFLKDSLTPKGTA